MPIYVDRVTQRRLERIAKKSGTQVTKLVNQLLKKDIELLETLS